MSRGFSLVELSIVLVILGLLTGGILAGQSLIRAAELRAVSTEYDRYVTASQTFRDKYFAIPGDFRDATKFWGLQVAGSGCTSNSGLSTAASPGACDGNGNGTFSAAPAVNNASEPSQFWRHLALAGLIEGTYSGMAASGGTSHCVIGTDCPRSKVSSGGWGIVTPSYSIGDVYNYYLDYGNTFRFGGQANTNIPGEAIMKPEEAWNIDTKIDDGKPARGKVIARFWNDACATPDDGATFANTNLVASYKLSNNTNACALYFRQLF